MKLKLCKNCKHIWYIGGDQPECHHEQSKMSTNVVTGFELYHGAEYMRDDRNKTCGFEGVLFEQKPWWRIL